MDWSKFFSMGGYALYVWGSYGVTFVLLAGEVLMLLKRKRNLAKRAAPQPISADSRLNTSLQGVQ
jgi:heme exporter protein D